MPIHTMLRLSILVALTLPGVATAVLLGPDEAPIDTVTVYMDRAQVERTAQVTVPAGRSEVTFDGLPTPLLPGSVRAVAGTDKLQVIGLTQRQEVHIEQRREEVRDLEKQLRELRADLRSKQVHDGQLQYKLQQIQQLREYTRATTSLQQTEPNADIGTAGKSLDLFRDKSNQILAERSTLQSQMKDLQQELSHVQRKMSDLRYGSERTTTTVTVTVETTAGASGDLTVSYGVGGVSWAPRYDIRYADDELRLSYLAQVHQASGEDWNDVRMIFTTARPDDMAPPPPNQPLHLSGYKEKETTVQLGTVLEEAKKEMDVSGVAPPSGGAGVMVTHRALAVDLEVTHPTTVPADGRPYRITVLEQKLEAQVDRYAAPRLSPQLFMRAQTHNETGIPLLPGYADIFRSSGYVGTLWMAELAAGEKLNLSLGPAGPLTVTRIFDEMRNRTVETGPTRKKVHFVYDMEVHNFGDDPYEVTLSETVPVSRVEQVKIKLNEESTTAGYQTDPDGSIFSWNLVMKPGEKQRVHLEYIVDLPNDYAWEGF